MKRGGLYVWTDLWLNAWPWQYHKNVTTQYLKQQCVFIAQSIFYFENLFKCSSTNSYQGYLLKKKVRSESTVHLFFFFLNKQANKKSSQKTRSALFV